MAGCGDHGCIIEKPQGMGTNGGCRCLKELPSDKRIEVKRKISHLEAENARLEREKMELVEALELCRDMLNEHCAGACLLTKGSEDCSGCGCMAAQKQALATLSKGGE